MAARRPRLWPSVIAAVLVGGGALVSLAYVHATNLSLSAVASASLDPSGRYAQANLATALGQLARGLASGAIRGSAAPLSATTGRQTNSYQVLFDGSRRAPGFQLGVSAHTSVQGPVRTTTLQGHVLRTQTRSTLAPPGQSIGSGADQNARGLAIGGYAPGAELVAAGVVKFSTGDPPGGRIVVNGNEVTLYRDAATCRFTFIGCNQVKAQHTFSGTPADQELGTALDNVRTSAPPAPDAAQSKRQCAANPGATSIANTTVTVVIDDYQASATSTGGPSSTQETFEVVLTNNTLFDCATGQYSSYYAIDFLGHTAAGDFQAIVVVPEAVPGTSPPVSTVPTGPPTPAPGTSAGAGPGTWQFSLDGETYTVVVDSGGDFAIQSAIHNPQTGCEAPATNRGHFSGTSVTISASASGCGVSVTVRGTGTANPSWPHSSSATGSLTQTSTQDGLAPSTSSGTWTMTRIS